MKKIIWNLVKYAGIALVLYLLWVILFPRLSLIGGETKHKVYVAFGFHGNMYHSFRIDTNDEAGFGKDIRVIRNTIRVLDKYNKAGVPVRGVWDIENLFTLQGTIPANAPDIIQDLRRRVNKNNDEMIIMSYNNGLSSAMNEKEFEDSLHKAISNPAKSGIKDLFGSYTPTVRPQEMMYTPGNYRLYQKMGIDSMSMYYSAITFDTFRVFSRELSRKEAHNPLYYVNKDTKEKMVVIPTYNIGDLVENVSLRRWVQELNREQRRGNIDSDVLLFINFDADDNFWYGLALPDYLKSLPNTGGLDQLIGDIQDLDFVKFTTLKEYMATHKPVGEVEFGQDTADGSFNGYNNWAEKAYSSTYWKYLEHDRRVHDLVEAVYGAVPGDMKGVADKSYQNRLRLLSTTNFGMATPYLARARERVVEGIINNMNAASTDMENKTRMKLMASIANPAPVNDAILVESFISLELEKDVAGAGKILKIRQDIPSLLKKINAGSIKEISGKKESFYLADPSGKRVEAFPLPCEIAGNIITLRFYVQGDGSFHKKSSSLFYGIPASSGSYKTTVSGKSITNGLITLSWDESGNITEVSTGGEKQLEKNSLLPKIHYNGKIITSSNHKVGIIKDGKAGVVSVRISGDILLPENVRKGDFMYTFSLVEGVPFLIQDASIRYPETRREDVIKGHIPSLARKIDKGWFEVMPAELLFAQEATEDAPFKILKRNYLEVESSYLVDYFRRVSRNAELDNINNHITAEYVGLVSTARKKGVLVAYDTTVLANFAFAPMKMTNPGDLAMAVNPFGTYFGRQYTQPTWGNGNGFDSAFITGEQYATAGPTFNGYEHQFTVFIAFFQGEKIPVDLEKTARSLAHPPYVVEKSDPKPTPEIVRSVSSPQGFMALYNIPNKKMSKFEEEGTYFHWEPVKNAARYHLYIASEPGKYGKPIAVTGTTFFSQNLKKGQKYYAALSAVLPNGMESKKSPEIDFLADGKMSGKKGPAIPISLQLKILMDTLISYVD